MENTNTDKTKSLKELMAEVRELHLNEEIKNPMYDAFRPEVICYSVLPREGDASFRAYNGKTELTIATLNEIREKESFFPYLKNPHKFDGRFSVELEHSFDFSEDYELDFSNGKVLLSGVTVHSDDAGAFFV